MESIIKELNELSIRGDLKITERLIETGEIIGEFEDKNIVLTQGKNLILRAFGEANNLPFAAKTIKIGGDVGSGGSILAPIAANAGMTEVDQQVIYTVPPEEFFVTYPSSNSIRFLATINGGNVMAQYPTVPNIIYTSASIYTQGDKAVTYKRFAARTISALISVDISWTITIT